MLSGMKDIVSENCDDLLKRQTYIKIYKYLVKSMLTIGEYT